MTTPRRLAVITGASSGIGLELARLCAQDGYDLIIVADDAAIFDAAEQLSYGDASVTPVQCDLSTTQGIDELQEVIGESRSPVDVLMANAARGPGKGFLDQDMDAALKVVRSNIDGTINLVHHVGRSMRSRGRGRILITGSIAGLMPGTSEAVYNGSKAFLDSFSVALSNELKDSGVTVTCLMPGITETNIFRQADMPDTQVPMDVARSGYDAMMKGE